MSGWLFQTQLTQLGKSTNITRTDYELALETAKKLNLVIKKVNAMAHLTGTFEIEQVFPGYGYVPNCSILLGFLHRARTPPRNGDF